MTRLHRMPSEFGVPKVRESFMKQFAEELQDECPELRKLGEDQANGVDIVTYRFVVDIEAKLFGSSYLYGKPILLLIIAMFVLVCIGKRPLFTCLINQTRFVWQLPHYVG